MKVILPLAVIAALGLAACDETMTGGDSGEAAASATAGGTPMPAGLSRDEVTIWNSLSEPAKAYLGYRRRSSSPMAER